MQPKHASETDALIAVGQAAQLLGVHPDTVKRWEKAGRIESVRTPTGHRRFRKADVVRLLDSPDVSVVVGPPVVVGGAR